MAKFTSDILKPVQASHMFDEASFLKYAKQHVEGFPDPIIEFSVLQFGHGQSNPTYCLEVASYTIRKRYVLRKKPPGKLLKSAHAIEREYEVLAALGRHSNVPVPKVYSFCTDPNVVGTPFYIMEYLEGRVFIEPGLVGVDPKQRRAIYLETAKTMASIHSVDVDAVGLGSYGYRENYCKRQVERWAKQYLASTGEGKPDRNPKMMELIDWLCHNIPEENIKGSKSALVHGDFRIDNILFHPKEDRVIGVLDWELSTLGNPMADVAYSSMPFVINNSECPVPQFGFEKGIIPDGIPSQAEYLADYCAASGAKWPHRDWKFYIGLSLFRSAAIFAGIYHRWLQGNASGGERAKIAGDMATCFVDTALLYIKRDSVLPPNPPTSILGSVQVESYPSPLPKHLQSGDSNTNGFVPGPHVQELRKKLIQFMEKHIYPLENDFVKHAQSDKRWSIPPIEEKLKEMARAEGLWNLWIPVDSASKAQNLFGKNKRLEGTDRILGAGLSNLDYAYLCEIMGRSLWAPQIFNCNAPDTGNMEVLFRYGTKEQQMTWLIPLLEGKIRSGFGMTEPHVASSDATNIECSITRNGESYIINGRKWWTSGAMDPRCKILIVMGKTDPTAARHKQQSMILVPIDTPGVHIERFLHVFGFDDSPHGHAEISFTNVRVPISNILLGEGRGFEIAQGRLGPGRLHHCMRSIGAAERGINMMAKRAIERKTFGKLLAEHGAFQSDLAMCRLEIEKARLLVLEAARQLDVHGNKIARGAISMAKVAAPNAALKVLDKAIQVHGAGGVSNDFALAYLWVTSRTLRIADGPDEVHLQTIAKLELARARL